MSNLRLSSASEIGNLGFKTEVRSFSFTSWNAEPANTVGFYTYGVTVLNFQTTPNNYLEVSIDATNPGGNRARLYAGQTVTWKHGSQYVFAKIGTPDNVELLWHTHPSADVKSISSIREVGDNDVMICNQITGSGAPEELCSFVLEDWFGGLNLATLNAVEIIIDFAAGVASSEAGTIMYCDNNSNVLRMHNFVDNGNGVRLHYPRITIPHPAYEFNVWTQGTLGVDVSCTLYARWLWSSPVAPS